MWWTSNWPTHQWTAFSCSWRSCNKRAYLAESIHGPAYRPFNVMSPQDMSSQWKFLCVGGSSANSTYFCDCCLIHRDSRGTPARDADRCARCIHWERQNCYDHEVRDTTALDQMRTELMTRVTTNPHVTVRPLHFFAQKCRKMHNKLVQQGMHDCFFWLYI